MIGIIIDIHIAPQGHVHKRVGLDNFFLRAQCIGAGDGFGIQIAEFGEAGPTTFDSGFAHSGDGLGGVFFPNNVAVGIHRTWQKDHPLEIDNLTNLFRFDGIG